MDCLSGLIGLRGCGLEQPGSGLYVNSLPGIPMDMLDKIADADQGTFQGLWDDTQIIVQSQLLSDFEALMGERYQIATIARSFQLPSVVNANASPGAAVDNGFTLDFGTDYPVSRLMKVEVDKIGIYLTAVPATFFDINITNYDSSEVLWTKQVNTPTAPLVTGWNYIDVLESFWCKHLKFSYAGDEAATMEVPLSETVNTTLCNCSGCPGKVRGITGNTFSDTVSYGLTASINFTCSFEGLICANRKSFARPMWYLSGATLMSQALASKRYSRFNTTDKEITAGLRDDYFSDYADAMKLLAKGIRLNDDDYCIECGGTIIKRFVTP